MYFTEVTKHVYDEVTKQFGFKYYEELGKEYWLSTGGLHIAEIDLKTGKCKVRLSYLEKI